MKNSPELSLQIYFSILLIPITGFLFLNWNFSVPGMSSEEQALFDSIQAYRVRLKLPKVPYSPNLTLVAQYHAEDLKAHPPVSPCNLHSWSGKTKGKACCYTPDHTNAPCMWDKPAELSSYPGKGYEISAMNGAPNANWLEQWKKSKGHHNVIINGDMWGKVEWKAMGLAIRKPYAVVWFGTDPDPGLSK